ncbi:MAG: hypothetical protein O2827_03980 [Verrucomicrobia bacterium]|nr:hypothetical protein [Verrucomicrobiota bacterium]
MSLLPLSLFVVLGFSQFFTNKESRLIFVLWIALLLIALLSFLINQSISPIIIGKPIRQVVLLMGLIGLLSLVKKPFHIVATAVFVAALINASVICAQYILDFLHMDSSWLIMPSFNKDINVAFRKPGLMCGYPSAGMLSLYGVLFGFWMIRRKFNLWLCLLIILLILTLFITARTALYLGALVLPLFFIVYFRSKSFMKMGFLFAFSFSLLVSTFLSFKIIHTDTIKVMFEIFITFFETGQISTRSSTALLGSLFYYPEMTTFLIGNGYMNLTDQLTNIDSGYQQKLFGGGIFYLILMIFTFFCYWFLASRSLGDHCSKFVTHTIFFLILITDLKGGMIFAQVVGDVAVMLATCSLVSSPAKTKEILFRSPSCV